MWKAQSTDNWSTEKYGMMKGIKCGWIGWIPVDGNSDFNPFSGTQPDNNLGSSDSILHNIA